MRLTDEERQLIERMLLLGSVALERLLLHEQPEQQQSAYAAGLADQWYRNELDLRRRINGGGT